MALVLPPMTTSILLRSPSPSPSPGSIPLPALQTDLSSSSSSSASGSCLDLHRTSSAPSTRRIRFAPLPDPRRDLFDPHDLFDEPQLERKPATHAPPSPDDLRDGVIPLSPSVSPDSTLSSARSTPTIRISTSSDQKSSKLFRFPFLRGSRSSTPSQSPLSRSTSLPGSDPLVRSSASLPSSPSFQSVKLPRFSTEDILILGTKSLFRSRSRSTSGSRSSRALSPPPKPSDHSRSLHRSASTGSGPGLTLGAAERHQAECSSQSCSSTATGDSGPKKRRVSSSALTPGAGGGRHAFSGKMLSEDSHRPSTAPNSPIAAPKKHVKMLNGRVYGAKRYAAQTLADPFANVREEPEFVEWGYGGMGSVHASAGIANDVWKGLQRSERGGALFAGSSFGSASESTTGTMTVGGGRGSGSRVSSPIARRKMSDVPECGMGNVAAGTVDEDDGSGMAWLKRRRAEREAKARLDQEAKDLQKKPHEGRKSTDSVDASMYASTASTATSLTVATSAASTNLTTPASSPLPSRSPSPTDLHLSQSPTESCDLLPAPHPEADEKSEKSDPPITSKDEQEHHVLTAVRLSPSIVSSSHKHSQSTSHGRAPSLSHTLSNVDKDTEQTGPLSPVDTEETTSTDPSSEEEDLRGSEEEEQDDADDDEDKVQDMKRKTVVGAGVEKISRHVDVEAR